MGNTVLACCCYRRKMEKIPKLNEDMKKAFGFSFFDDTSSNEEEHLETTDTFCSIKAEKIKKIKKVIREVDNEPDQAKTPKLVVNELSKIN